MSTINIKDASGATVSVEAPLTPGRANASASRPITISNEDLAALGSLTETAPATDTASSGLNGRMQRVNQRLTSLIAQIPATLGIKTAANSLSVTHASDDVIVSTIGSLTETAPATDTASSGLNGRMQRVSQRLTSLIGLLPTSLGVKTAANSLSVTHASDDAIISSIGTSTDAIVGNGAAGTALAYLRTIKDGMTDITSASPVLIQTPSDVISFTPTLDTSGAYAVGDVLFATAAISGVTRANDLRSVLMSLTAIDKSKQAPAFTIYFYQTNVTSAAANAANNLSDADAINCLGFVDILGADWKTLANNSFLCYSGVKAPNLLLEAATGTTTVYAVGILTAGTPTFAAGDLVLKFGVVQS